MEVLVMVALGLLLFFFLLKWNEIRYRTKGLPPGTMGWPFLGETGGFIKQGPRFMTNQSARYGIVFKTHVLGSPTVISMDPELNRYILSNEDKGLVPGYPKSMVEILGPNIATVTGSTHKYIRRNLLSHVGVPFIKDKLLASIVKYTRLYISNWDGKTIDIQEKTVELAFLVAFKQIAEAESSSIYDNFKREFDKLKIASIALPINLPGTNYNTGLTARRNVIKILTELMKQRRASPVTHNDILENLLRDVDAKYPLNDEEIIEQIITILYSGYETVSKTLMMTVKYLHDHPGALQQLRDEHFEILKRKPAGQTLDWDDYKAMKFTRAVILETSRLATIVNGVLRKTTEDIILNGFFIPKGWKIYVYTREINYDPGLYPEPRKFNPWRWLDDDKLESHNYCLLFGGGTRLCPGKELGIAKVAIFLHYFVTAYRWEEIGGEKIAEFPRVEAPNGYHIKVKKL